MRPGIGIRPAIVIMSIVLIAVAAGIAPLRAQDHAQDYPSRSITVIVPFPAGGASDVVARIVTNQMSQILGQPIIVENVGGAGGTIGSARAAAAAPDGYTLLVAAMGSHVAAPVLTPNVKYNPLADFAPIGITAHSPAVVIARKDFPARDLKEFVAVLRQQGDALKQAHGGIGASSHMACLLFTEQIGAKPTLVAYRGSGPALNDLIGGHVDFMCEQSVSVAEAPRSSPGLRTRSTRRSMSPRSRKRWPSSAARFRPRPSATRPRSTVSSDPKSRAGRPFSRRSERISDAIGRERPKVTRMEPRACHRPGRRASRTPPRSAGRRHRTSCPSASPASGS